MIHLFPSNLHFTIEQVRSSQFSSEQFTLTENERATLAFCQEWLSGVASFTVNTSGSTGTPKPIAVTRQQMEASALATAAAVGLQPGMQMLVCMPTRFIAGKMMLVRGLVIGMEMTVVEPSSNPLADLPANTQFDFTALTPMQIGTVIADCGLRITDSISQSLNLQSPISTLNAMHAILLGGGPVSATLEQQLQQISAPIYHTYGMTETVSHVALRRINGSEASEDFRPLPGVILGVDERGCLNIRAPMTNNQTLQTNDIVDLHADGSFHWLGRWDNVINSGGVKVQVEKVENEIEQLLRGWGDGEIRSRRFFVAGLADERLGERVTLVIEGKQLKLEDEQGLLKQLHILLSHYEVPRSVQYVAYFYETPTGKIDRKKTIKLIYEPLENSRKN